MHRFWNTVIGPSFETLKPKVVVEIGSDEGLNTKNLLAFCEKNGGRLHVIDPLPRYDVEEWRRKHGGTLVFHQALSLDALPEIEAPDAVLIDGDHNWYTVFNELKLIEKKAAESSKPFPLVMLHDVGWPYGRRDLYYDPESIPPAYRNPHERKGMAPGSSELLENGGLNRPFHNATYEGGSRNGVLTAVEDFLQETEQRFEFTRIPSFYGMGVLVPSRLREQNKVFAEFHDALIAALEPSAPGARQVELVEQARLETEIAWKEQRAASEEIEARRQRETGRLRHEIQDVENRLREAEKKTREAKEKVTEGKRKNAELRRQLKAKNTKSGELRQQLKAKNTESAELRRRLAKERERVRLLTGWIERLVAGVSALLSSRQWRTGHALGEIQRMLLRRPRVEMAPDQLRSVMEAYREWRRNREYEKPASGDPTQIKPPPQAPSAAESKEPVESAMSRDELAREIRNRLGPPPDLDDWPSISIVVLNRNGLHHLEKLFAGLRDKTDCPGFEVVLVDNGSTDASVKFARSFEGGFPVKLIENQRNVSFSEGNNQGAEAATGELLLFLNNDVEPFEPGWLKEMASCIEAGAGAVGARLLYPSEAGYRTPSGYAVQHRGIKVSRKWGSPRGVNLGAGEDALDERLGEDTSCPAATAACLLIRREVFDSVGGFPRGYRYGREDVDLGFTLTASGRTVVSSGRAVLFHHEFGTQDAEEYLGRVEFRGKAQTLKHVNLRTNHQLFSERWGPRMNREFLLDRLDRNNFWSEMPGHIAITVTSHDVNDGYGDWYTAHEIGDALEARGWRVTYLERENKEWQRPPEDADYLLALLHWVNPSQVRGGVTKMAWIRNQTNTWLEHGWLQNFDVVLASSGISKKMVERETNKTATIFPIATNPERFTRTPPNPAYEADYVFTGNHWTGDKGHQRLVSALDVAPDETFMIFGKGWEHIPRASRYARGHLPYEELPAVYSSTTLLIDDNTLATMPFGSVNSRVFDALGMGTLVVSNNEAGAREMFDEDFPTYNNRQELRENLDLLLNDEERRNELARRYQGVVLREHTYEKRAEQLEDLLRRHAETPSFCLKIGAPNWEKAPSWGDTHFARAMQRQLERRGHPCLVQVLEEWDDLEGLKYDVAIHLKGLEPYVPKPGQFNVLWNISHPELVTPRECGKYDLVFIASERFAQELRKETSTPVLVLDQATDPEVFFPDPDPEYERELVFVGNSRKVERRIIRDLLPTNRDLAVWGGDWEGLIDNRHIAGRYLPNVQVRKAYSSAAIVLNDHWDDMREHGFVSNRIYDALACGALVFSDYLPEIEERFGDSVVTYKTPEELEQLVEHYLSSPEERAQRGRRGREKVLAGYTFEQRVDSILREVMQRAEETGFQTRILPPARTAKKS